jgi:uncharacterized protein
MKTNLLSYLILLLMLTTFSCGMQSLKNENAPVKQFDIEDVQLLDGPFKSATELNQRMLLKTFEPDRLLARFRIEAGLDPKAEPYEGWEAETIAGHTLGHYLTACALMYSTTQDVQYKERVIYIVDELALCQQADPDGYIGAFANGKKIFTEEVAKGNIRSQGFDLNGIWAPFYTQHKILSGLIAAKQHCDYDKGIEVAVKFSDWIQSIVKDLDDAQIQKMLDCEYGGINESFVELYAITNDKKFLDLSEVFYHKKILDSLAMGVDILPGKHANTQIPKLIGLARRYELTGKQKDHDAAVFFWDRVVNHHSYVTGGHCNHEYFGRPDELTHRLSDNTTETCNVYNMLKLSRHLFEWEPTAEIADFYERALFNHILSSQHPLTGEVIYNLSLEMGGFKAYQNPYWFTCCVGTGLETHSKYSGNIYYHNDVDLYVGQYMASKLNWAEKGLVLTQKTKFPEEQGSALIFNLEKPTELNVKIRYPYWAVDGIEILVNNKEYRVDQSPGSFISIEKTWKDGDVISVRFPFSIRLESMPDDEDRIAVMYGPLVLAGDLGEVEDSTATNPDYVPVIMTENKDPKLWITPVAGQPNVFQTVAVGTPRNFTLRPFYQVHDRRYSVYFDVFNQEKWVAHQAEYKAKMEAKKVLESKTVDYFQMGEMQPERDHSLKGDSIYVDEMKGKKARVASRGGYFEFKMDVLPDQNMSLVAEYWGGYTGSKTFDIEVEGQSIATENISDKQPGAFIDIEYNIPQELTKGKKEINVAFKPHVGHRAGPVFSMRTIR